MENRAEVPIEISGLKTLGSQRDERIKVPHGDMEFAGFQLENEVLSAEFYTQVHPKGEAANRR